MEITGLSASSMYSLPKIMWIWDNCPEIRNKTRRICLMEDYVVYLLTGKANIDYSLASRTMAFDINKLSWSSEILNAVGIDSGFFSEPVPLGTSAGNIKPEICRELGFKRNVSVVSVGHDQAAAAVGGGVFDDSCSVDGAGTVECITPVFKKYDALEMAKNGYAVIPYIIKGSFICYAFSFTGGALIDWFQKTLAGYAFEEAKKSGRDIHAILEKDWNGSPSGLLVLPHFAGAATPYMDSGSKGAVVGLTLGTTQQQLYSACLEGVCYEMRLNVERLNECGIKIKSLRAVGGGAKSDVWLQMKADILGIPVTRLGSEEAGAVGSAMLTGIAAGVFEDLKQAADIMVSVKNTYFPRPEVHKAYEDPYQRYKCLYNAVRPLV